MCELVGDGIVVMDSGSSSVMSITGHGATAVKRVLSGEMVGKDEPGVSELLAQGILIPETSDGLTRRSLMMGGVAIGAGGVLALSLPPAAHASSVSLLLTPVFDNDAGFWGWDGRDDISNEIRFPQASFTNEDDYSDLEPPFVIQWSFSPDGGFNENQEFALDTGNQRYEFKPVAPFIEVPDANNSDPGGFGDLTLFLRVRSGTRVSQAVEVLFDND